MYSDNSIPSGTCVVHIDYTQHTTHCGPSLRSGGMCVCVGTSVILLQILWKSRYCFDNYSKLKVGRRPVQASRFGYLHIKTLPLDPVLVYSQPEQFLAPSHYLKWYLWWHRSPDYHSKAMSQPNSIKIVFSKLGSQEWGTGWFRPECVTRPNLRMTVGCPTLPPNKQDGHSTQNMVITLNYVPRVLGRRTLKRQFWKQGGRC